MQFNSNQFNIPEVTKNLVIINVLLFVGKFVAAGQGINLNEHLALFHYTSPWFRGWQVITHMFMHADMFHLFFNMFGLWMFGTKLEQIWGAKRFINFYLITGLGAAILQTLVISYYASQGSDVSGYSMLGASGALFGILVGFAMYWPNTELYLMFVPIPIKAKYAVIGYAAFELFSGVSGIMPGVAHFAHLGGALFGFILIKFWNKNNRSTFY